MPALGTGYGKQMGPFCGASLGSRACHPGWSQLVCPQCRLVMDESTGGNDWRVEVCGGWWESRAGAGDEETEEGRMGMGR